MKVYVGYHYHTNTRLYRNFKIVEGEYNVGDLFEHEEIMEIEEISPDIENNSEVFDYDLFHIYTTENGNYEPDADVFLDYYIAVKRGDYYDE